MIRSSATTPAMAAKRMNSSPSVAKPPVVEGDGGYGVGRVALGDDGAGQQPPVGAVEGAEGRQAGERGTEHG
jgi:hypothetical protein